MKNGLRPKHERFRSLRCCTNYEIKIFIQGDDTLMQ